MVSFGTCVDNMGHSSCCKLNPQSMFFRVGRLKTMKIRESMKCCEFAWKFCCFKAAWGRHCNCKTPMCIYTPFRISWISWTIPVSSVTLSLHLHSYAAVPHLPQCLLPVTHPSGVKDGVTPPDLSLLWLQRSRSITCLSRPCSIYVLLVVRQSS